MAVDSVRSSGLNPNAPLFIPASVHEVEDFSPKWWDLVKNSTWFRDYWLNQHKDEYVGEAANGTTGGNMFDLGIEDDIFDFENEFEKFVILAEAKKSISNAKSRSRNGKNMQTKALLKNLTNPKSPKSSKSEVVAKHMDKPPQLVNLKCAPRRINQPR